MTVVYTAVQRFDPGCGEAWRKFLAWSGLTQLREVVSLDLILCPTLFRPLTAEDWRHKFREDFQITLFHDLCHVLRRAGGDDRASVLALMQDPTEEEVRSFTDPRFAFRGFDLVELRTGVSALVNCGGFDGAFAPPELSECGLLTDHAQAVQAQRLLRDGYPDERRADCDLWAVWQMRAGPSMTGGPP